MKPKLVALNEFADNPVVSMVIASTKIVQFLNCSVFFSVLNMFIDEHVQSSLNLVQFGNEYYSKQRKF